MPDDLGECLLYALGADVGAVIPRHTAQEEHRAERLSTWSGLVIPDQEPVQVIKCGVLQADCIKTRIVLSPLRKRVARALSLIHISEPTRPY